MVDRDDARTVQEYHDMTDADAARDPATVGDDADEPFPGTPGMAESEIGDDPTEPEGPAPIAVLDGLVKRYGDARALGPLTLRIERGCVGLLGPNGAGKSTLIRLMMGLMQPSEGTVTVLGETVHAGERQLRRRIGYVPEGDARFPGLTGVQAVQFAARLVGMDPASAVQRAHQVLDYVGLGEARYRDVATFSTGMRQRLKIAQALVHDPELLILDEPTEGVDPEAREEILSLIAELVREHDMQLILSTHLMHDVERIATHAIILNRGHVVEHGPVDALKTGAHRGYQVRVDGDATGLIEHLAAKGLEAEWMGNALRVGTDDPRALLGHVQAAGLVIRHIAPVELSLNEVFEAAVSRPIEDPDDLAGNAADDEVTAPAEDDTHDDDGARQEAY